MPEKKKILFQGYSKDDFGCFRCSCIEDSYIKTTQTIKTTKVIVPTPLPNIIVKKEPCSVRKKFIFLFLYLNLYVKTLMI